MSNTSKITATIITRMITDFRFIGDLPQCRARPEPGPSKHSLLLDTFF